MSVPTHPPFLGSPVGRVRRWVNLHLGGLVHWLSDELHLLAHRLIGDPEWRARNSPEPWAPLPQGVGTPMPPEGPMDFDG